MNLQFSSHSLAIIAGPNGAGKSTVAQFLRELGSITKFINAEDIARSLARGVEASSEIYAGRQMLSSLHEAITNGENLAFESTMSGKSWVKLIEDARRLSYAVTLSFVAVDSVKLAQDRVAAWVRAGGHDIPSATIQRRYARSLQLFFGVYASLVDNWYFFDNSGDSAALLAYREGRDGTVGHFDRGLYERYKDGSHS